VSLVPALDWLMLARTTALGFGYLPARGVTLPPDLAWLRPVLRNGVTPVVLLMILIMLVRLLPTPGQGRPRDLEATFRPCEAIVDGNGWQDSP
jgi:hypothetical protein